MSPYDDPHVSPGEIADYLHSLSPTMEDYELPRQPRNHLRRRKRSAGRRALESADYTLTASGYGFFVNISIVG
jgi:hypothetical protein